METGTGMVEMRMVDEPVANQSPLLCEGKEIDFLIARCCNGFSEKILNFRWFRVLYSFYCLHYVSRFQIISDTKVTTRTWGEPLR